MLGVIRPRKDDILYKRNVIKLEGYGVFIVKSITTDIGLDKYVDSYTCHGIFVKNKIARKAKIEVVTEDEFLIKRNMSIGDILKNPWKDWDFRYLSL